MFFYIDFGFLYFENTDLYGDYIHSHVVYFGHTSHLKTANVHNILMRNYYAFKRVILVGVVNWSDTNNS